MEAIATMRCISTETKNYGWGGPHPGPLEAIFEIAFNPEPVHNDAGEVVEVVVGPHMTSATPYATARILFAEPEAHEMFEVGGYYRFTIAKAVPE